MKCSESTYESKLSLFFIPNKDYATNRKYVANKTTANVCMVPGSKPGSDTDNISTFWNWLESRNFGFQYQENMILLDAFPIIFFIRSFYFGIHSTCR